MGKLRNKWGHDRHVPGYGVVEADGILTVPDEAVEGFACQAGWDPDDAKTLKVYERAVRDRRETREAEPVVEADEVEDAD